jgi:glycosyltransferase involved in cell wall biosynthesis
LTEPKRSERDLVRPEVVLLTGGQDPSYAFGLATTLSQRGIYVNVVGNDRVDHIDFHKSDRITFIDCGGLRSNAGFLAKLWQLTTCYTRLIAYVTFRSPKIVHILWNNKAEYFDRTLLTLYFKCIGKKVVLTAHNVNKAKRDSCDSVPNRLTLAIQYRLADRIFVHTEKMKSELTQEFGVSPANGVVVPFGMNIQVPDTELTVSEAKQKLGVRPGERTILFFGRIVPYKGLECLVDGFHCLARRDANCQLIIAGEPMKGFESYMQRIRRAIAEGEGADRIRCRLEYIPDNETEVYFKAADVVVVPYKNIFESGVIFLAYRFGLPVIASDVGSFREELTNSGAGLLFEPGNSAALAANLDAFFKSELYKDAANHRQRIREYSRARHSWETVGEITELVYSGLREDRAQQGLSRDGVARRAKNLIVTSGARETALEKVESRGRIIGNEVKNLKYVLITPSRNEAHLIEKTLESVMYQTVLPLKWVIVNDGSTDATADIVGMYAARHSWIELVNRPARKERHFAGKVHAFNAGLERVKQLPYEIIGNLDADVSLESDHFEFLLSKFSQDSRLGVAGTVFTEPDGYNSAVDSFEGQTYVSGQCQLFRRQCFEEIGGYVPSKIGGIDWMAVTTARMIGWNTRSFREKSFLHHRILGTAERGVIGSNFAYGKKDYVLGGHPLWQVFRCAYRMTKRPYLVGGAALFAGYCVAFLTRAGRPVSRDLMRFHRSEQMLKLKAIASSLCRLKKINNFELLSAKPNPARTSPAS